MPRPGFLTPSTFPDLMQKGKNGDEFGQKALVVIRRLAMDMLKVARPDDVSAPSLEWGKDYESDAIFYYESKTFSEVKKAKWQTAPDLNFVGGTGDGLIGKDGGIEVKCPKNSAIHLFDREAHFKSYKYQVHGYIWIYKRKWWDFTSYDPRCSPPLNLITRRVERDDLVIEQLKSRCIEAHTKATELAKEIRKLYA